MYTYIYIFSMYFRFFLEGPRCFSAVQLICEVGDMQLSKSVMFQKKASLFKNTGESAE